MIRPFFQADKTNLILQAALNGYSARHEAIVNNIANVDTGIPPHPGFLRRRVAKGTRGFRDAQGDRESGRWRPIFDSPGRFSATGRGRQEPSDSCGRKQCEHRSGDGGARQEWAEVTCVNRTDDSRGSGNPFRDSRSERLILNRDGEDRVLLARTLPPGEGRQRGTFPSGKERTDTSPVPVGGTVGAKEGIRTKGVGKR